MNNVLTTRSHYFWLQFYPEYKPYGSGDFLKHQRELFRKTRQKRESFEKVMRLIIE